MIWWVLLVVYGLVAIAVWADSKSWGSLVVALLWPLWVALFILEALTE